MFCLFMYCVLLKWLFYFNFKLGSSIHGLVTDIQVNVYIGNTLSRLSFQN